MYMYIYKSGMEIIFLFYVFFRSYSKISYLTKFLKRMRYASLLSVHNCNEFYPNKLNKPIIFFPIIRVFDIYLYWIVKFHTVHTYTIGNM